MSEFYPSNTQEVDPQSNFEESRPLSSAAQAGMDRLRWMRALREQEESAGIGWEDSRLNSENAEGSSEQDYYDFDGKEQVDVLHAGNGFNGTGPFEDLPADSPELSAAERQDKEVAVKGATDLVAGIIEARPDRNSSNTVETPYGTLASERAPIGGDGDVEIIHDDEEVIGVSLEIGDDPRLAIEVIYPERPDSEVLVNGAVVRQEDMPKVKEVIDSIKEQAQTAEAEDPIESEVDEQDSPEQQVDTEESQPGASGVVEASVPVRLPTKWQPKRNVPQPQGVAASSGNVERAGGGSEARRQKYAGQFVGQYGRLIPPEVLKQAGVDLKGLGERVAAGKLNLSRDLLAEMSKIAREMRPDSALWQTKPGANSLAGRAADESRARLARVIASM